MCVRDVGGQLGWNDFLRVPNHELDDVITCHGMS